LAVLTGQSVKTAYIRTGTTISAQTSAASNSLGLRIWAKVSAISSRVSSSVSMANTLKGSAGRMMAAKSCQTRPSSTPAGSIHVPRRDIQATVPVIDTRLAT
jgi:hypothetical protein